MIDVHAPEHRISGKRDFFVHLFTITIGLLIALGLENAAEAWHHRNQRIEAEENIRVELEKNRAYVEQGLPKVRAERDQVIRAMKILETRSRNQPADNAGGLQLRFEQSPMEDAAWRTASSTGVLSYMPYAEVQRFSAAYKEQQEIDAASQKALEDYLEIGSFVGSTSQLQTMDAAQATDALPIVRHAVADLNGMLALAAGAEGAYKDALGK